MKGIKAKSSFIITSVLVIGASVLFISLRRDNKALPPAEYVKWVQNPDNGLNVSKQIKDVKFTVQYQPANYLVANKERDPYLKATVLNSEVGKYTDLEYYDIRLASAKTNQDVLTLDLQNQQDYYSREKYYSFGFENDIYMISNNDTIPCALFNYVPNYGIAPYTDFMIAFTKSKNESKKAMYDHTIVIEDKIFGNGILKFEIKKSDINKIPPIITY
jgi:hypothetical protein